MDKLPPFSDELLLTYDPETLYHYIQGAPVSKDSRAIHYLSANLIAKGSRKDWEKDGVEALELARQIDVRAPDVKRIFKWKNNAYVIMERVNGSNLHDCWHMLGWLTTFRLAFQLRGFVRRMRNVTSLTAGGLFTGECTSVWTDEDIYGLPKHASSEAMAAFFNFWSNFLPPAFNGKTARSLHVPYSFRPDAALVFIHQDLAPRNMMVDDKSRLWLVDWDHAGWFPVYFEYVSMQNFWTPLNWTWLDDLRWFMFSFISVGRFQREKKALDETRYWSMQYRFARKEEVLEEGANFNDHHLRKPGR